MSQLHSDKEPVELKRRAFIVIGVSVVSIFLLAIRLWYLQVKNNARYVELSQNNSIRLVKAVAPRGIITDRNGIKISDNRPSYDLSIVPEDIDDLEKTKEMLGKLIEIDPEEIDERLGRQKNRPPFQSVRIKGDMTWEEMVLIDSYKFEMPGVSLDVTPKRSYLYGPVFAHVIGYIGEVNDKELSDFKKSTDEYTLGDNIGKYGIEKYFEKELRGRDGGAKIEVDAIGRKIKVLNEAPSVSGGTIKLTLDLKTQIAAYAALDGRAGAAVAIEPSTGQILALVSSPSFDPNALSTGISKDDWLELINNPLDILNNRTIQGLYPPASTFKPINAAAALEEKIITPSTKIFSGASYWFAGKEFRDWKAGGHGNIAVHKAIVQSSDTFFYQVGLKLGVDKLSEYAKSFGLGTKTGIALVNEKSGVVPSVEWKRRALKTKWYEGETVSFAVGQGYLLTTPLQLANAYAAIANGGTIYEPALIDTIKSNDGEVVRKFEKKAINKIAVSAENLKIVKDALAGVTSEEGGTASFLKATNLKIAGKTGTAQVAKLTERVKDIKKIPYKFRDHAWFAGYAPYDDPKIAVVVLVEHGGFGASAAAPVAREIFKAYLGARDEPVRIPQTKQLKNPEAGAPAEPAVARAKSTIEAVAQESTQIKLDAQKPPLKGEETKDEPKGAADKPDKDENDKNEGQAPSGKRPDTEAQQ